jgi:hypothetical protein
MTTRFDNLSAAQIIDLIGEFDCQRRAIEDSRAELRAELERRGLDAGRVEGEQFYGVFALRETKTLDKKAVVAELGQDWVDANSKSTVAVVFTVHVNKAALAQSA